MKYNVPHVIFYDPLPSEPQHSACELTRSPEVPPKKLGRSDRRNRKEAERIKELEAVSRDLAILAAIQGRHAVIGDDPDPNPAQRAKTDYAPS